jgi:hypothetical protein
LRLLAERSGFLGPVHSMSKSLAGEDPTPWKGLS